jgi:hypothetical protein
MGIYSAKSITDKCKKCERYYRNNCRFDCDYANCFDKQLKRCKGFLKQHKPLVLG